MFCKLYSIEIILYYYFVGFLVPLCYLFALPVSFIYFLRYARELLYLRVYLSKQLYLTIHRNPKLLLKMKLIIFSSMLPCLLLTFCSGEKQSTILVIIYTYMYQVPSTPPHKWFSNLSIYLHPCCLYHILHHDVSTQISQSSSEFSSQNS